MILVLPLLLACGYTEPPPPPPPEPPPPAPAPIPDETPREPGMPAEDPALDTCTLAPSSDDANRMYGAGKRLSPLGSCTFEEVNVRGTEVGLVFETADGTQAPVTLHVSGCLEEVPEDAAVHDPWILLVPDTTRSACGKAVGALEASLAAGAWPKPSEAR